MPVVSRGVTRKAPPPEAWSDYAVYQLDCLEISGSFLDSQLTARYFPLAVTRFVSQADAVERQQDQRWYRAIELMRFYNCSSPEICRRAAKRPKRVLARTQPRTASEAAVKHQDKCIYLDIVMNILLLRWCSVHVSVARLTDEARHDGRVEGGKCGC